MMFLFRRPDAAEIMKFISGHAGKPYSYRAVGATNRDPPQGFVVDHNRIRLGQGSEVFDAARRAITEWKMFDIGWVELYETDTPIATGQTVAVLAKICGLWFLNACRIVYTVDEDGPVGRFGLAYGTLPQHAESGEERFTIEWNHADDSVWYDVLAFSRPNQTLAKIAYPLTRRFQKRFARDSKRAVWRHCQL